MRPLTLILIAGAVLALANSDRACAQDAIVKVDAKPKKPAFGAWNKPTVVRTAEEAAKHFGEEALKNVDFKKQIVLIFAWQGSGQDKLSYTVAESFPEQIRFTRKPGLTRDLRPHVHVFALRSNVKWSADAAGAGKKRGGGDAPVVQDAAGGKKRDDAQKPTEVRQLKFKPADPTISFKIGGKNKLTTLADAAAVEAALGKASAKALIDAVNFEKEQIVLVSWSTSGPPEGRLMHETKRDGKDRKITFYIQGPRAQVRGQRLRIAADFFAVPRGVEVAFDAKER